MQKYFNFETKKIHKITKRTQATIIRKAFHADCLNLPLTQMLAELKKALTVTDITNLTTDIIYYDIKLSGQCTKEDVEDFYTYVENVLTDLYCTEYNENSPEQERLGLYGLPQLNLKTMNYLRWIKSSSRPLGFGFEVGKLNDSWSKRMIK